MGFIIDDKELHNISKDFYSSIKDNINIPQEIKDGWRDMCVECVDIKELCN